MTVSENERRLVDHFSIIQDPHERLSVLVSRAPGLVPLAASERTDAHLVRGCVSQVWLAGEIAEGVCRFRTDADSPMVRGLVALLCEVYDGAGPADVIATEPTLWDAMGLTSMLSPTRLNGLAHARERLRAIARDSA